MLRQQQEIEIHMEVRIRWCKFFFGASISGSWNSVVKVRLRDAEALGPLVRAVRKHQRMRQDDTADGIGVSENFLGKIERGGTTVQWGKLFHVLSELGVYVEIDIPDKVLVTMMERERRARRRSRPPPSVHAVANAET